MLHDHVHEPQHCRHAFSACAGSHVSRSSRPRPGTPTTSLARRAPGTRRDVPSYGGKTMASKASCEAFPPHGPAIVDAPFLLPPVLDVAPRAVLARLPLGLGARPLGAQPEPPRLHLHLQAASGLFPSLEKAFPSLLPSRAFQRRVNRYKTPTGRLNSHA